MVPASVRGRYAVLLSAAARFNALTLSVLP